MSDAPNTTTYYHGQQIVGDNAGWFLVRAGWLGNHPLPRVEVAQFNDEMEARAYEAWLDAKLGVKR